MQRRPVNSSAIASMGYDPTTNVLEIEFHETGVYRYFMVAPSVYEELAAAASIGRVFQDLIKDRYRTERVD